MGVFMDFVAILFYLLCAFFLFFVLNYFDKNEKESNLIHALVPVIYLILLSGLLTAIGMGRFNDNLFVIVFFELCIRLYYVKNILRQEDLMNASFYIQIYGISLLCCYLVNRYFISQVSSVFLTAEEMKPGIWFGILLFFFFLLNKHVHIQYKEQVSTFHGKKKEYILVQYVRLKTSFGKWVKVKDENTLPMIYAMMVYENYHRPKFFRTLDKIKYRFTGRERKMGIMQIKSKVEIDDVSSIKLSIKKLEKILESSSKKTKKVAWREVLEEYYGSKQPVDQIVEIYNLIVEFNEN